MVVPYRIKPLITNNVSAFGSYSCQKEDTSLPKGHRCDSKADFVAVNTFARVDPLKIYPAHITGQYSLPQAVHS